jgi:hypothetical protein
MSKTKIYFPGAYDMDSQTMTSLYHPLLSASHPSIEIVDDVQDCDYIVIQDQYNEPLPPEKKVLFFQKEPAHIHRYHFTGPNECLEVSHEDRWMIQTPWISLSHDELVDLEYVKKTEKLSVVESGRTAYPGHINRLNAIQDVCKQVADIHVYGHITRGTENVGPFKTSLPKRAKESALLPYKYALAIENGQTPHYFSEKIVDPLLCWTTPIYWGCSNIGKYFPKGSYLEIKDLKGNVGEQVAAIIEGTHHEDNIEALAEARDLILNKYNLIPTIESVIKKGKMKWAE